MARPSALALLVILMTCISVGAAEDVVDKQLHFSLQLPDGFVPRPELINVQPDIVHAFGMGDPTDDQLDITLVIERMRGVIDRKQLTAGDMPAGFRGNLSSASWKGFEVQVISIPETIGSIDAITYNVQIPLKPEAIQIKLFGGSDRKEYLRNLLPQILAGLDGQSNWIASAIPSPQLTNSDSYGNVLLGGAIVLVAIGVVGYLRAWRTSKRGTILILGVVLLVSGSAVASYHVREALMFGGSLKFLGSIGVLLGIIDLLRKRKPESQKMYVSE